MASIGASVQARLLSRYTALKHPSGSYNPSGCIAGRGGRYTPLACTFLRSRGCPLQTKRLLPGTGSHCPQPVRVRGTPSNRLGTARCGIHIVFMSDLPGRALPINDIQLLQGSSRQGRSTREGRVVYPNQPSCPKAPFDHVIYGNNMPTTVISFLSPSLPPFLQSS